MTAVRWLAKRLLEEAVTQLRLHRPGRALRPARGAVLAYHKVVPVANDFLRNVVSERPRVALTFDDA